MKKEKQKLRFALALLYSLVVFLTVCATVLFSAAVLYLLLHFEIIAESGSVLTDSKHVILYMILMCMIVGLVIAMVTSDLPLIPMNRTISCLRDLADGNLKTRLRFGPILSKHSTIAELADSFNIMAEELENTEMLRSDFINNFSHEFKTPIVSIAGFAKLLKRGNLSEQQKIEYLNIIEEESIRLSYMATNVLNLSKVENQTILTNISTYNLSEQIRNCMLLLENRWADKKLEICLEFDEYIIRANEELLKEVWINLLDNAIKFSAEYGVVDVKIQENDSSFIVHIANLGNEIPLEKQEKIFQKFYQGDESHASEGNGVGLAIVKSITELHGGSVTVQCENGMTTFSVELPKM